MAKGYNIRPMTFKVAEVILRALNKTDKDNPLEKTELEFLISEDLIKIQKEAEEKGENRVIKAFSGSRTEDYNELRRIELIEKTKIEDGTAFYITSDGKNVLKEIENAALEQVFYNLLYEREELFRNYADLLVNKKKLFTGDSLVLTGSNQARDNILRRIIIQTPIAEQKKEGRRVFIEYVPRSLTKEQIISEIIQRYRELIKDDIFLRISIIWDKIKKKYPFVTEKSFDAAMLSLADKYPGEVELIEGATINEVKLLYDTRIDVYYHYITISPSVLEKEGGD